jgi:hypothetical protein
MSRESRMLAGILLITLPTVMFGEFPAISTTRCDTIFFAPDMPMRAFISSFHS